MIQQESWRITLKFTHDQSLNFLFCSPAKQENIFAIQEALEILIRIKVPLNN